MADPIHAFDADGTPSPGAQIALGGKADAGHKHVWADLTDAPTSFPPATHSHTWAQVTGKPTTFTPTTHAHTWAQVTDKPATFPPAAHTHPQSEITGLAAALTALTTATADTGWQDITVLSGFTAQTGNEPQVRKIGNLVVFRGGISGEGLTANTSYQCMEIPAGFRPDRWKYLNCGSSTAASMGQTVVQSNGGVQIRTAAVTGSYYMLDPCLYLL